jgi:hypothetical protein
MVGDAGRLDTLRALSVRLAEATDLARALEPDAEMRQLADYCERARLTPVWERIIALAPRESCHPYTDSSR